MRLNPEGYGLIPIVEVDQFTIDNFTCGTESLDSFLKVDAKAFHENRIGYTYCVFHDNTGGIVGYFTLSTDSIRLKDSELLELAVNSQTQIYVIPAFLIGKLAVRSDLQRCGNGQQLVELAIDEILDSEPKASRLVVVDAINNDDVISFYESCQFQHSLYAQKMAKHHGGATIKMFRDLLA